MKLNKILGFVAGGLLLGGVATAGPVPGSPGVSGYVPKADEDGFFLTLLDSYYCAVVADQSAGGVGIEKRIPTFTPDQYHAIGNRVMADPQYGLEADEIETLPQILDLTARIQYEEDLENAFNGANALMLATQLPACEAFYIKNNTLPVE